MELSQNSEFKTEYGLLSHFSFACPSMQHGFGVLFHIGKCKFWKAISPSPSLNFNCLTYILIQVAHKP